MPLSSDANDPESTPPEDLPPGLLDRDGNATSDVHLGRMIDLPIEDELKNSYLTYAMSVIVSRACPTCGTGSSPRSGGSWWR